MVRTMDMAVRRPVAGFSPGGPQPAQDLIAINVGQHEIENDYVVFVQPANFEAVLAKVRAIADETLGLKHHGYAFCCCRIVFDQEYAHRLHPIALGERKLITPNCSSYTALPKKKMFTQFDI